jgi:hypothetical protein
MRKLILGLGVGSCWLTTQAQAQTEARVLVRPGQPLPQQVWKYEPHPNRGHLTRPDSASPRRLRQVWYPDWALQRDSCELLLNCGHQLTAPGPLGKFRPRFRFVAAGATLMLSEQQRRMTIMPFADRATIWAYRRGKLVFKHSFKVWRIPPPMVQCSLSAADQTLQAQPLNQRQLTLRVKPNETFGAFLPDDARYRVSRAQVSLRRGGVLLGTPLIFRQEPLGLIPSAISLTELPAPAQPGDQLLVEVQAVQRKNFCDEVEELVHAQQFVFPLL